MKRKLLWVVNQYIQNTPRKGYVKDLRIKVCDMPRKLKAKIKSKDLRVYITTKSLKHMYDVRTAQEFDFIIQNIESAIKSPTKIFKNKEGKTGDICYYTEVGKYAYFHILEIKPDGIYIVSAYRLSDIEEKRKNYLSGYKLIWSWKGDSPSS